MAINEAEITEFRPSGNDLFTPESVQKQINFIRRIMSENMKEGHHYGIIPGTKKPTLLKPGAEMLGMVLRLAPTYERIRTDLPGGHREYEFTCTLTDINTGKVQGQGVGMASSMESNYRYRQAMRVCPECGADKIMASKAEYGGGWFCLKKAGGCGRKFAAGSPEIESQQTGKVEADNPADQFNTILKMAKKRAHIDNVFSVTACSDIFTTKGGDDDEPESPATKEKDKKDKKTGKAKGKKETPPAPETISETAAIDLQEVAKEYHWTDAGFIDLINKFGFHTADSITHDCMAAILEKIKKVPEPVESK